MCLYPRLIKNRKYTDNKKNGGNIPPVTDERTKWVPIGCQNCMECRKQKAREWQIRLLEDIKTHTNGKFITLTLSNTAYAKLSQEIQNLEGYERDNAIATLAVRRWLERYRKQYKKSIRHWLVTELGHNGTENIHLHGIIWTDNISEATNKWNWQEKDGTKYNNYVWQGQKEQVIDMYGTLKTQWTNYVNERTTSYITKYVHKQDEKHKTYKAKILTSPGIGHNYTKTHDSKKNKYNGNDTIETYRTRTGHKISLPIYWRNKIYTEQQREKLWLQRLDKQERWICGERISIKHGEKRYYKLLAYHQNRNERLGYGTDKKDWQKQQYEKERRNLMIKARIQKAQIQIKGRATRKKVIGVATPTPRTSATRGAKTTVNEALTRAKYKIQINTNTSTWRTPKIHDASLMRCWIQIQTPIQQRIKRNNSGRNSAST